MPYLSIRSSVNRASALAFMLAAISPAFAGQSEKKHGHEAKEAATVKKEEHRPLESRIELFVPDMDPVMGKKLFIEKACITCHAVNGVGGTDAPVIDAHVMSPRMNAFQFGARMWNHSQGMVAVQIAALGEQVELNGQELAHITAFVHDDAVQHTVKDSDIPHRIREKMHHEHGGMDEKGHMKGDDN